VEILAIAIRNQENIKKYIKENLDSAQALFELLQLFEKASGLKLNVTKTEAMWIGSLQNRENEPLGVKCITCVKFLGIYIAYNV